MGKFDDLPIIKCLPRPVPVGHPEHPDFCGYDDPVPDTDEYRSDAELDWRESLADDLASAWWRK